MKASVVSLVRIEYQNGAGECERTPRSKALSQKSLFIITNRANCVWNHWPSHVPLPIFEILLKKTVLNSALYSEIVAITFSWNYKCRS